MGKLNISSTWLAALVVWETYLRAANRPETTIYLRTYHLRRLAADHPGRGPWDLTFDDLLAWLGLHAEWATETRRAYRASVRGFYSWAVLAGRMSTNPAALLPPIRPPRGKPRPASDRILMDALSSTPELRVRLMLELAAYAGLRRSEVARVHTHDVVEDDDGWSLRVTGKGQHVRIVPLTPLLARDLRDLPAGWAFPAPSGGHLTPAHVGKLISRQLPAGWAAHTLRHRFATTMRANGVQVDVIRELLGHARVETTLIYSEVPHTAMRSAVMLAA